MSDFTVLLAGVPIRIIPRYPEVESFFSAYICDEQPAFSVTTTDQDIAFERMSFHEEIIKKGKHQRIAGDYVFELRSLLRCIAKQIIRYNVLLFHGSALAVDGKAYLFTAPSGTGKTTHTRLWLEQLPDAFVLNGDKPFVKVMEDGSIFVCGVPWKGKEGLGCNKQLPLEAICILERDESNHIHQITPKEAINTLISQAYITYGPAELVIFLQLLDQISSKVRLFRLGCNMDPEAACVSIHAMIPDKSEI